MPDSAPKPRPDYLRLALHLVVYVVLYFLTALVFGQLFLWLAGYLAGNVAAIFFSAFAANWLTLRIYANRSVVDLGLHWTRPSIHNLLLGLAGGIGAACLVLVPPLLTGAAHFARAASDSATVGAILFVTALLAAGAAGEELFFRGYGFQLLIANIGPYATIFPVGIAFAALHSANPNSNWFGLANTAGFGILFGYAYLRSRDLWLPIGLHFGWNLTFPLFGVNLSGLRINVTGYEMSWTAGVLWSGGDYGPEASVLTSAVLLVLLAYLVKAPIRRQSSAIAGPSAETVS